MFCNNCKSKLNGNEKYCSNCGNKIEKEVLKSETIVNENEPTNSQKTASIILGSISLCCLLFIFLTPLSLILAIIGLVLAIKTNKTCNNVIGIVLNAIGLFLSALIISIIILLINISVNIVRNGLGKYGNLINNYVEKYTPSTSNNV